MASVKVCLKALSLTLLAVLVRTQGDIPNDLSAHLEIDEESPPNSFVGNIAEAAGLRNVFNATILEKLEYNLIPQPQGDRNYFQIDSNTGDLRTISSIDRDTICAEEETCFVTTDVAIRIRPNELFQIVSVSVSIADVNDHAPLFQPSQYSVTFSEADPAGTSRTLPVALDNDSPQNGVREYRIGGLTATPEFSLLQVNNPINGQIDVKLRLASALDRETRDSYQLLVEAVDRGTPALVGSLLLDIHVEDDNDHSPRFTSDLYDVQVPEDMAPGAVFFSVEASDNDLGENADILYGFSPRTQSKHADLFQIAAESGEIMLKGKLDFEEQDVYHLEVTATDQGANSRSSVSTVKVQVLDVNDHKPRITISTLTDKPNAEIQENQPAGKFTAHVSVLDADSGQNGMVSCGLLHPLFELQSIRENQYKIVTVAPLDRELAESYILSVDCHDLGDPSFSSVQNITVIIMDLNDNRPTFSQYSYSSTVSENLATDAYVTHVHASDGDFGVNGQVTYEILQQNVTRYVKIDSSTGTVTAVKLLDFEEVQELRFTIRASNGGEEPLYSDVPINIRIIDANDNAPEFLNNHYIFYVHENEPARTFIGRVSANDPDSSPYNIFDYSLSKQNPLDRDLFHIDHDSGSVYTTDVLDHEERSLYYLNIYAKDIDNQNLVGMCTMTIIVQDRNDNAPVIHFPQMTNSTFSISNAVPVNYNITKIFATDPDEGFNGNISFKIISGNEDGLFKVDHRNGFIQTNKDLSSQSFQEYELGISIHDNGEDPLNTDITVKIVVDESVPYFRDDIPTAMVQRTNLTIIIAVAAVSGFVIVILIIAIVVLKTTDCRRPRILQGPRSSADKAPRVFTDLNIKAIEANGYLQQKSQSTHLHNTTDDKLYPGTTATDKDVHSHSDMLHPDVLHKLERGEPSDSHSVSSADLSNTDSGRGLSEEGGDVPSHSSRHNLSRNVQLRLSQCGNNTHRSSQRQLHPSHRESIHGYSTKQPYTALTESSGPSSSASSSSQPSVHTKPYYSKPAQSSDNPRCSVHNPAQPDTSNGAHGYPSSGYHGNSDKIMDHLPPKPSGNKYYNYGDQNNSSHKYTGGHHGNQASADSKPSVRAGPKRVIHAVNV